MDREAIKQSLASHVEYTQGKDQYSVSRLDFLQSLSRAVRDRLMDRWNKTTQRNRRPEVKRVYYLSLEFLMGRLLRDGLVNLGLLGETRAALEEMGLDLDDVLESEWDAALGNGGLGRLAACFLDSMATLGIPAMGCGIRYEYGVFRQSIVDGAQVEGPDNWLRYGNPWEMPFPERLFPVRFHGRVQPRRDERGRTVFDWVDTQVVMAMAYDVPVPGFRNGVVNTLRLWSAKASREFDFHNFNRGDYIEAVHEKNATENISRVLYPNDQVSQGRELRLKQEHFFVSATLQDALRRHIVQHKTLANLHEKAVFQLNDTHPALAVPELMRLLVDERGMGWDESWAIASRCFAYTNHTVLPEALEQWPVSLLEHVLPRHLQILYEINERLLGEVRRRWPGDEERVRRMSLVAEGPERRVRMANVAIAGSFSVNGVSALHSKLVREQLFPDFADLWPQKFNNKTNGITPRRWLLGCNPALSRLISSRIGDGWITDLEQLRRLAPLAEEAAFRNAWREAKRQNKLRLCRRLARDPGVEVDPASMFDVQVKRLHEYKRQLLNILEVYAQLLDLRRGRPCDRTPRTVLFGGKAAPGYEMAKRIIRLIGAVARAVNGDPEASRFLRVVFVPNYGVSLAELLMPAADLSEQISTAGTEASGTGNMKFALNGALTIGTLDGANVEIRDAVGPENFFLFGLDEPGVREVRARGYDPWTYANADVSLREALESIAGGELSPEEPGRFRPIVDSLLRGGDTYLLLADFASYRECRREVAKVWADPERWTRMSILNAARMGRFSSDVTIANYAREIWGVEVQRGGEGGGR
ncbi:MAG: glycogen/starch/alpha-glucan phosphorylase [Deltaproteobacteria bacterium]|nr:glycogen/starch/alpha-glucan phosphorylase [Deltaproteobacteria bacterium]